MLYLVKNFIFFLSVCCCLISAQFTISSYPDPRTDPIGCRIILPGNVCDPNEILIAEDRQSLNDKIQQLQTITSSIKNISPPCQDNSGSANLKIIVALVDKLGVSPLNPIDIERFTNGLRQRYMNYQDVGMCDTMVLIVNSRLDRQVFTVAGRDARLSRDVLQTAFQRNIAHFRAGSYITGLEGMIKYIASAYNSAHIMQVPSPSISDNNAIESVQPFAPPAFITNGIRHKPESKPEKFSFENVPEEDRLWVELLIKAVGRCGNDPSKISTNLRAVVEEAMKISLQLLSDNRYNKIEEQSQDFNAGMDARDKAWQNASTSFINDLYSKYGTQFPRKFDQCPEIAEEKSPSLLM